MNDLRVIVLGFLKNPVVFGHWSPLTLSPMSYVERYEYILLDHLHELAHRKIVDIDPERVLDLARSRLDPEEAVSWG